MQFRCTSNPSNCLYSLIVMSFAMVLISTQALAEIWINVVPGYSQLPQCAEMRLSAVVRGQSSGCGQITSYSCFCEQSYTTMNKIIATAVSSACNDIGYVNSALDVFGAYCQSPPLTPFSTTAAVITSTFIDAQTTASATTTLLPAAALPVTPPPLEATSTLPPTDDSPSTISAPSLVQPDFSPSASAPFSSIKTTFDYQTLITSSTKTSSANQSPSISSETSPNTGLSDSDWTATKKGLVAGIVLGALVIIGLLWLGCAFFLRHQKHQKARQEVEKHLRNARTAKDTLPKTERFVDAEYDALTAASKALDIFLRSKDDEMYQKRVDVYRSLLANRVEKLMVSPSWEDFEESLLISCGNLLELSKKSKSPEVIAFAHYETGNALFTRARLWERKISVIINAMAANLYSEAILEFNRAASQLSQISTSTSQIHLYHVRALIGCASTVAKIPPTESSQLGTRREYLLRAQAILQQHANDPLLMGEMSIIDDLLNRSES